MRLHETQDVHVWSVKFPAAFSKDGWGLQAHPSSGLRSDMESLERGQVFGMLSGFYLITCIASTTVGFPMTSLLRCMGDFPVPSSPVGIWGQWQHSLWQYPVVQNTGLGCVTRFCANLPKTSSKGPQGCTGNRGRSRDVRQVVSTTDPSFLLLPLADNENQFMQDV